MGFRLIHGAEGRQQDSDVDAIVWGTYCAVYLLERLLDRVCIRLLTLSKEQKNELTRYRRHISQMLFLSQKVTAGASLEMRLRSSSQKGRFKESQH